MTAITQCCDSCDKRGLRVKHGGVLSHDSSAFSRNDADKNDGVT